MCMLVSSRKVHHPHWAPQQHSRSQVATLRMTILLRWACDWKAEQLMLEWTTSSVKDQQNSIVPSPHLQQRGCILQEGVVIQGAWVAGRGPARLAGWERPGGPWQLAIRTGSARAQVELQPYFGKMCIGASVTSNRLLFLSAWRWHFLPPCIPSHDAGHCLSTCSEAKVLITLYL